MVKKHTNKKGHSSNPLYLWMLYVIAVVCGAVLMGLQILGGRLLSPFFGASVYVWGSVISVFLIALSTGYYVGGIVSDKRPSVVYLAGFIAAAGMLTFIIPPLAPPLSRFFFATGLVNYGALVVSMILFFLPSVGLGMVSPYVVKLGVAETDRLGNMVGKFYSVSTFGSIFGTLATTFVLIPYFGVNEVIFTLGAVLVTLALAVFVSQRLWRRTAGVLVSTVLILTAALTSPTLAVSMRNMETVFTHESMYNDIFVGDQGDIRYLIFTEKLLQSGMLKTYPNEHLFSYTRLIDEASAHFKPDAGDFLLIGLGGGSIPKALLAGRENITVDSIEIDQAVIDVAYDYFDMPKNDNFRTIAMDGRMFLQATEKQYDVIMLDAYNSLFIPYHLTTNEFFEELAAALKPDGIAVLNIISNPDGEYSRFFKSLLKTVNETFPEWRIYLAEDANPNSINNIVLVASRKELGSPGPIGDFIEYREPLDFSEAMILTDNYAPVELLAADLMKKF
ncbi:MAG: fused MFS/spermidine synthase [Actinobacteria bacterium]|nr:fused MFS/spermidine synthase [Actinomycetota bacterium]